MQFPWEYWSGIQLFVCLFCISSISCLFYICHSCFPRIYLVTICHPLRFCWGPRGKQKEHKSCLQHQNTPVTKVLNPENSVISLKHKGADRAHYRIKSQQHKKFRRNELSG